MTSQARQLGYYETVYSWRFLDTYLENARKVTKADVQRAANEYLTDGNRTVVTFVPEEVVGRQPSTVSSHRLAGGGRWFAIGREGRILVEPRPWPLSETERENILTSRVGKVAGGLSQSESRMRAIKPTRVVLDNGLTVIVHENRSNPTVAIQGSLNAGSMLEPQGKCGLAGITADLLLKGTSRRTADQIAAEKDFVGASLDTGAEVESATFSGYSLSKHFDLLLDLLSDVLRNPTFPAEELEKLKAKRISTIKEERDNPAELAFRAFYGSVFPQGHPYHRPTVDEELAAAESVSREDVLGFYAGRYGPEKAILVVVGDVDTQEAIEKIESYFGDWKSSARTGRPAIPDVPLQPAVEKKLIPMRDKSQVDIVLGYAGGLKRSDPDFYAAQVMNFVLGGGGALGSRLGDIIRDEMGLAYEVYSMFSATLGAGPWYAYLGANPENADKAIKALLDEMIRMRGDGAAKRDMEDAVDYIAGSFPVRLEKNAAIANILHAAELYGLGMDYIQNYQKLYRAVTLEQVNAAAGKYLHPDRYTLVIAGPYEAGGGR